jgi:bifunctional non-homologous end joining protein LigD
LIAPRTKSSNWRWCRSTILTTAGFSLCTCAQRETLTIAGFALDGTKWDGLYIGRRKGNELVYAGKVDHGFDKVSAADLRKRLAPLVRKTQPYSKRIAHKGIWVEPKLLAEIEYRAKSAEGKVRHPFFRGLREDL